MNLHDLPMLTIRIRALREIYPEAHAALVHWGDWSHDKRGIFPTVAPPALWDQYRPGGDEGYGEEHLEPIQLPVTAKAEPAPTRLYNERLAVALDERLHGYGGPNVEVRRAARTAYVSREIPEEQFARLSGCTEDAFCERLETLYCFVRRFI